MDYESVCNSCGRKNRIPRYFRETPTCGQCGAELRGPIQRETDPDHGWLELTFAKTDANGMTVAVPGFFGTNLKQGRQTRVRITLHPDEGLSLEVHGEWVRVYLDFTKEAAKEIKDALIARRDTFLFFDHLEIEKWR